MPWQVEQMAEDVAVFLTWTAEPHMMDRKAAGARNVGFLVILSVLLYLTNKALWASVKKKKS
jgi:ubiquinol-cytochrome c reductase cytochrome c1 subunit